nr:hypothetical protein [uncultured Rhodopila sp.]
MRAVVVSGNRQHAAVFMRPRHVGAVERVAGAVHARTLAVPHAVDAVVLGAREGVEFLRAVDHRGGEVLVDARLEADVVRRHQLLLRPEFLVEHAERGAPVARHQSGGVQPGGAVEAVLLEQQPQQRLDAGEQHRLVQIGETRLQGNAGVSETDIHGRLSLQGLFPSVTG